MKGFTGAVALTASLLLAACGGPNSDADEGRSAAPDVGSETTPPPVPLPPETEPMSSDSGPAAVPASPSDTSGSEG